MNAEAERAIKEYLRRIEQLLPPGFETEDLIEDLREHILQSFASKMEVQPSERPVVIVHEILEDLGNPEDIAEEQLQSGPQEAVLDEKRTKGMYVLGRLVFAVILVIIAAAFVAFYTGGEMDFGFTLAVLLVFVIAEWYVRAWQAGESSPFGVLKTE
jgi:AcrR family transcriptional regulator